MVAHRVYNQGQQPHDSGARRRWLGFFAPAHSLVVPWPERLKSGGGDGGGRGSGGGGLNAGAGSPAAAARTRPVVAAGPGSLQGGRGEGRKRGRRVECGGRSAGGSGSYTPRCSSGSGLSAAHGGKCGVCQQRRRTGTLLRQIASRAYILLPVPGDQSRNPGQADGRRFICLLDHL
jgi:hypothetical protein